MSLRFIWPQYWPTWFALALMRWLARRDEQSLLAFGQRLGDVARWLPLPQKRVVRRNLELALPELDVAAREQLLRAQFREAGVTLVETAVTWFADDQRLRSLAEISGLEHFDAARAEADGHALGEHLHRALAGGVRRDARPAQLTLDRADIDDAATAARHHVPRHGLSDEEHAVEVGAHQHVPVGRIELVERRAALDAGVVDEDVDRADLGLDAGDRLDHSLTVANVEGTHMHRQAFFPQACRRSVQTRRIAPDEHCQAGAAGERGGERREILTLAIATCHPHQGAGHASDGCECRTDIGPLGIIDVANALSVAPPL